MESLKILTKFREGLSSKYTTNPENNKFLYYKGGRHIRGLSLVTDKSHQEGPDKAEQALQDFIGNDQNQMQSDKLKIFISLSLKYGVPLPKIKSVNEYNSRISSSFQSNRSNNLEYSNSIEIDGGLAQSALFQECQNQFMSYLAVKLQLEEQNRLKTEEQSAMVIEQLGQTMQRIELERNKNGNLSSQPIGPNKGSNLAAKAYGASPTEVFNTSLPSDNLASKSPNTRPN